MASLKNMVTLLESKKNATPKTPISDFKSVDFLNEKQYLIDNYKATTTFGSLTGSTKWQGGVLAPNGKIYGIPYNSTTVLEIDPVTKTATTFGSLTGSSKWIGGVLAPNGKIYGIPWDSTTVLEIDPVTRTATTFGSLSVSSKWAGGVLAPNGKIYGIPWDSTTVLEIDTGCLYNCDWALSPLINKF